MKTVAILRAEHVKELNSISEILSAELGDRGYHLLVNQDGIRVDIPWEHPVELAEEDDEGRVTIPSRNTSEGEVSES